MAWIDVFVEGRPASARALLLRPEPNQVEGRGLSI
jgi:hypothetical protein